MSKTKDITLEEIQEVVRILKKYREETGGLFFISEHDWKLFKQESDISEDGKDGEV